MSKQQLKDRDVPSLKGAQARLRDSFFANESGLFILDCNPGAGKSTVTEQVAAEALARSWDDGVRAPEQTLCIASFARDDAAAIIPGISKALKSFAADPECRVELSESDAEVLTRRLRETDTLGTIDSILRTVFGTIAPEVGFSESPAVGDDSLLTDVHSRCLERVRSDDSVAETYASLSEAYPCGRYKLDLDGLLTAAFRACRERRLSIEEFQQSLVETIDDAYPDGPPSEFADIITDIRRFVDTDSALETAKRYSPDDRVSVVKADNTLFESWRDVVEKLCSLLGVYRDAYDKTGRELGVVSHLDAAHWVANFFDRDEKSVFSERLRARYTESLSTVIVDEAQDVSVVQHDALSHLIDEDTRVLVVGDTKQCIYTWRNAHPQLFEQAAREGDYFGIEWETHVVETAARTYRSSTAIAGAINTIFEPVFQDSTRGGSRTNAHEYPRLVAARESGPKTGVHVAAFEPQSPPGTRQWVSPPTGVGEADALAQCVAARLADGTFGSDSVTVLFPRRTYMGLYERAFASVGLSVSNSSEWLFDYPLIDVVKAVCQWLVDPMDSERVRELVLKPPLGEHGLIEAFMRLEGTWSMEAAFENGRHSEPTTSLLQGLCELEQQWQRLQAMPGTAVVETVLSALSLWADPYGFSDDSARRVAALDALCETVAQWESATEYPLSRLAAALDHYCDHPKRGSSLPGGQVESHDVQFKTIHQMKGRESDVVVLADISGDMSRFGPYSDVLVARGAHLGLAPPANTDVKDLEAFCGLDFALYDASSGSDERDAGLRWATERWADGALCGPSSLARAAADYRAEQWRLLYVALTRARDHLVIPLPTNRKSPEPRDRWVDTLRETLSFDDSRRATYDVSSPSGESVSVAVHRGERRISTDTGPDTSTSNELFVATAQERTLSTWNPRFVNPSTLYPLAIDASEHIVDYLLDRALQTARDGVSEQIPLTFESLGPEVVGDVTHGVLTEAVRRSVPTSTLQTCSGPLVEILETTIRKEAVGVNSDERQQLRSYVAGVLCPQFAESELWQRLQEAPEVYVEESLDTVSRVDGVDVEIQSHADFVSKATDGTWHVDDLKVSLQPPTEETSARYSVQAETYGWILSQQVSGVVESGVTRIGIEPAGSCSEVNPQMVLEHLRTLR
ncbi:UvrD/REP helicase [Haloferax elongans ATCC BAA-1513]|uniref:DNA 3'-5' helicase n=1 Tax=Haloferax elongans ATCC BAA-1513 TaxID=1230453 RepID=M0I084_HALEO|nr:UvrD-helicase domain-containing protein [Haloferax elongans]ELZ88799.1 UvrD/REP helicase [Haloferax elongans ATCC BAA-1513]